MKIRVDSCRLTFGAGLGSWAELCLPFPSCLVHIGASCTLGWPLPGVPVASVSTDPVVIYSLQCPFSLGSNTSHDWILKQLFIAFSLAEDTSRNQTSSDFSWDNAVTTSTALFNNQPTSWSPPVFWASFTLYKHVGARVSRVK